MAIGVLPCKKQVCNKFFYFLFLLCSSLFICRLRYIYSFFSLVDLITVLPIYDDLMRGVFFSRELYTFQFLRVLRVVRILRVNRILHLFSSGKYFLIFSSLLMLHPEITRYFFKAFVTIFTFILVVAGFYMNIESMYHMQMKKYSN